MSIDLHHDSKDEQKLKTVAMTICQSINLTTNYINLPFNTKESLRKIAIWHLNEIEKLKGDK